MIIGLTGNINSTRLVINYLFLLSLFGFSSFEMRKLSRIIWKKIWALSFSFVIYGIIFWKFSIYYIFLSFWRENCRKIYQNSVKYRDMARNHIVIITVHCRRFLFFLLLTILSSIRWIVIDHFLPLSQYPQSSLHSPMHTLFFSAFWLYFSTFHILCQQQNASVPR